jgi:hypothetical protein
MDLPLELAVAEDVELLIETHPVQSEEVKVQEQAPLVRVMAAAKTLQPVQV